jgi:predicted nuclease with TOPRIM domain
MNIVMVYGTNNGDSSSVISSSHERLQTFEDTTPLSDGDTVRLKAMAGVIGQFDDCDDTPREVDLLTEEHVEDLLDAVECLRGKVEQLQIQCEKLSFEKGCLEEQLILQEKNSLEKSCDYEQEVSSLRKLNLQLMVDTKNNEGKTMNYTPYS